MRDRDHADGVECGSCHLPLPLDDTPPRCPKCGSFNRAYVVGEARHYVLHAEGAVLRLHMGTPDVIVTNPQGERVNATSPTEPAVDEVRVPVRVPAGSDERTRLLARIGALVAAVERLAGGVQDFDKQLFIGKIADLQAAIGVARGTKKDIADGRVIDSN